jgi:hypothetical protein
LISGGFALSIFTAAAYRKIEGLLLLLFLLLVALFSLLVAVGFLVLYLWPRYSRFYLWRDAIGWRSHNEAEERIPLSDIAEIKLPMGEPRDFEIIMKDGSRVWTSMDCTPPSTISAGFEEFRRHLLTVLREKAPHVKVWPEKYAKSLLDETGKRDE